MNKPLIIVGDSAFAEIAYEYFRYDSEFHPTAFAVEAEYRKRDRLFDLPVVDVESLASEYPADEHYFFAAIVYGKLNRTRTRLYLEMKQRGYRPASYISTKAFIWRNVKLGEHCFIFENNVVQPFTTIGDNVILWSGNHIGHHCTIDSHCFISSHVVISGYCKVKSSSFFGVNATIANNLTIGRDVWLSPGACVTKDIPDGTLLKGSKAAPASPTTYALFDVEMPES
ncbi:MAG: acetyltransferase [Planctomycetaceae bacterium]|nr:acetyltransferase [Planctomycetales bacterium]MCB9922490.1 acetyltransferase [Planctomycetaceae bacterium]